jgi:hypothetical protein
MSATFVLHLQVIAPDLSKICSSRRKQAAKHPAALIWPEQMLNGYSRLTTPTVNWMRSWGTDPAVQQLAAVAVTQAAAAAAITDQALQLVGVATQALELCMEELPVAGLVQALQGEPGSFWVVW